MVGLRIDETNRQAWIVAATSCTLGLVVLDETVLGVALPTMRAELGFGELTGHRVINA